MQSQHLFILQSQLFMPSVAIETREQKNTKRHLVEIWNLLTTCQSMHVFYSKQNISSVFSLCVVFG